MRNIYPGDKVVFLSFSPAASTQKPWWPQNTGHQHSHVNLFEIFLVHHCVRYVTDGFNRKLPEYTVIILVKSGKMLYH